MPFRICLPLLLVCSRLAFAESGPNPLAVAPGELIQQAYTELRSISVDPSRVATAENVEIHKGPARFTLRNGQIAMLKAVAGRTVGAVFVGEGRLAFAAQNELEKSQTARYNDGQAALDEPFDRLVMLFTGDEAGKLESQAKFSAGSAAGTEILDDLRKMFRKRLRTNIEAQTLASVVSGEDLFLALVHGKRNGDLIFSIDPFEAEEVSLMRIRGEAAFDIWNSFPLAEGEPGAHQGDLVDTIHVGLNTRIQTNADIQCDAEVTFRALRSGLRMLPFRLAPKLRVTDVTDGSTPLRFIQENEKEDADLWVMLPAVLEKDREYSGASATAAKTWCRRPVKGIST